jgi:hypothetical protein
VTPLETQVSDSGAVRSRSSEKRRERKRPGDPVVPIPPGLGGAQAWEEVLEVESFPAQEEIAVCNASATWMDAWTPRGVLVEG